MRLYRATKLAVAEHSIDCSLTFLNNNNNNIPTNISRPRDRHMREAVQLLLRHNNTNSVDRLFIPLILLSLEEKKKDLSKEKAVASCWNNNPLPGYCKKVSLSISLV
jgi:hypothetical protein